MPHLANPADPAAEPSAPEDPLDLGNRHLIAQRPGRGGTFLEGFVARRGNFYAALGEHSADWLDPEPVKMIVDEVNYHGSRGSSSRAKNEEAANRISLVRLSSRIQPRGP